MYTAIQLQLCTTTPRHSYLTPQLPQPKKMSTACHKIRGVLTNTSPAVQEAGAQAVGKAYAEAESCGWGGAAWVAAREDRDGQNFHITAATKHELSVASPSPHAPLDSTSAWIDLGYGLVKSDGAQVQLSISCWNACMCTCECWVKVRLAHRESFPFLYPPSFLCTIPRRRTE